MLAILKHIVSSNPANRSLGIILNFRKWVLVGVFLLSIPIISNQDFFAQTTVTYTSSGTFVVPSGVTSITVECWGGGGKGGDRNSNGSSGAGGGGGGAYASSIITVTPGTSYSYSVGSGATTTSPGGDTWFSTSSTVMAKGGNSVTTDNVNGATGGLASVSIGTIKFDGGIGVTGTGTYGGGGGSSAGTAANGVTGSTFNGGVAPSGGGNGGIGRSGSTGSGSAGSLPGGGGGGAYKSSNSNVAGGAGASGQIKITYNCPYNITQAQTAAYICSGTTTAVQVTGTSASLPIGTYTVNYSLTGANTGSFSTTMNVTTAGTGSFTASNIVNNGTTNISVTSLVYGGCNSATSVSCLIIRGTLIASTLKRASDGGRCGVYVSGNPIYCPDGTEATYSWEYREKQNDPWISIAGNGRDFFPATQDDATRFRYQRTATCGSCTSVDYLPNPIPGYMAITAVATSTCSGLNNGTATVTVSATSPGIPPYNYTWRNSGGTIVSQTNVTTSLTNTANGLAPGVYTVSVQDQADQTGPKCTATANVTVEENIVTPGTIVGSQPIICSGIDPNVFTVQTAANGSPTGGIMTYQWQSSSDNTTWANISGATSAIYDAPVLTTPAGVSTTYYYRRIAYYAYQSTQCSAISNVISITVDPLATVTTVNSCIGSGTVTFTQTGGLTGGTWSVSGGGNIDASTGVFIPTTPGCYTASYKTLAANCTDTKNFVVFPQAPLIAAPANTCNSSFALPAVAAVAGFTVHYSIDGGAFSASPTITATPGCHSIKARYVLTSTCGTSLAGSFSSGICGESNTVNVLIFPTAPVITAPVNTCNAAFSLPTVPSVSGFNIEYSIDGSAFSANPFTTTPGCHTVLARYVLATDCGSTAAGAAGTGTCGNSNLVNVIIFPASPTISAPANTCNAAFTLPVVPTVAGFNVQYSLDGGTYSDNPSITVPGCHTVSARYILVNACGATPAGTAGIGTCGFSNTVSVVIFPVVPAAPVLNSGCGPIIVNAPASVSSFNIEYSFDNGLSWGSNTPPTIDNCTGYYIKTRYVTSNICGSTPSLSSGIAGCAESPATLRMLDTQVPVLSCNVSGTQIVNVNSGVTYVHAANGWNASVTDNCSSIASGNLSLTASLSGASNGTGYTTLNGISFNIGVTHVTWTATDACGNTSTCTFDVDVLGTADIQIVKTAPANIDPGATITYTLVVTNNGPALAQQITLNDAIPASISNPEYSLNSGGSWSVWSGNIIINNLINQDSKSILIRGKVNCTATVSVSNNASIVLSTITDPDLSNNTSTVTTAINNFPVLPDATGLCIGKTLNLFPSTGGTWSSNNPSVASVTNSGLVTGISAGLVNFTFTITATGCNLTTFDFTIYSLPTQFNVTGGGTICSYGAGIEVGLSGSESGISYQLFVNSNPTGSPVIGNGWGISFGNQTTSGTYTVVGTNLTTSCVQNMNGSVNVILNSINPGSIEKGALNPGPACDPLNPNNIGNTISGNGSGVITYKWEQSTDGGTSWQPAVGSPASGNLTFNPDPMHVTTWIRRVATSTLNGVDCSAYSNILIYEVYPVPPVAYITPVAVEINICVNSTYTIYNTTPGGTWSSANPAVANVSGGIVTGVSAGDVVLSYTVSNEHCSNIATRTVHIKALPSTSPIYHR